MKPATQLFACVLGVGFLMLFPAGILRADWPTLHNDYQRSGWTGEVVKGPYERKWWRDVHDEMIATRCEAIVAEKKVFAGTFAGTMYALNVSDGKTAWRFTASGPTGASPCYHAGKLYFGSDDAFNSGSLYCVDAAGGALLWKAAAPAGIWSSPACDGKRVYVGDRSGVFHCVDAENGTPLWTFQTGGMILQPASFSTDGKRIVFGSEDMHVYCLSPEGRLLWKTPKLPGLSLRDYGPTIWNGLVIVGAAPADAFHTVLGRDGELLEALQRALPVTSVDTILLDKWGDLLLSPRPERRKAENRGVVEYLKKHPYDQSFFAFSLSDGTQPWIAPVFYRGGLHNVPGPPTFNPETGALYVLSRSALTHYVRGVRRYSCLVRIDRATGLPDWVWPESDEKNWRLFPMIPDETQALGMMHHRIIGTHQGVIGALDPDSGEVTPIAPKRDTYAGIFGPGALPGKFEEAKKLAQEGYLTGMPNEWHGPARGIVSVSDGRMFWIAGSQVVCIAGPDIPITRTGGNRPPEPFKMRLPEVVPGGNVANIGRGKVDRQAMVDEIAEEMVLDYLSPPDVSNSFLQNETARAVKERLDAEVLELVRGESGRPWAPFVLELGIGGEERYFWRTSETMRVVSCALPYLSKQVRAEAVHYLDRLFKNGSPLKAPVHASDGARREPYLFGPQMAAFAAKTPRYEATIGDLYALWAYAHHAGRWEEVLGRSDRIRKLFERFEANTPRFDPDDMARDAAQHLNRWIAGLIASVRIFERSRDTARKKRAVALLCRFLIRRIVHEKSDHRLIRPTKGERGGIHKAKVPRYVDLVPELSEMLWSFASEAVKRHTDGIRKGLPLWYQAYGERMIGGENYISPLHLSQGVFLIWSAAPEITAEELGSKLDQPWCRAELSFIEKCTALLRES